MRKWRSRAARACGKGIRVHQPYLQLEGLLLGLGTAAIDMEVLRPARFEYLPERRIVHEHLKKTVRQRYAFRVNQGQLLLSSACAVLHGIQDLAEKIACKRAMHEEDVIVRVLAVVQRIHLEDGDGRTSVGRYPAGSSVGAYQRAQLRCEIDTGDVRESVFSGKDAGPSQTTAQIDEPLRQQTHRGSEGITGEDRCQQEGRHEIQPREMLGK
jgi:hypothetical protein